LDRLSPVEERESQEDGVHAVTGDKSLAILAKRETPVRDSYPKLLDEAHTSNHENDGVALDDARPIL